MPIIPKMSVINPIVWFTFLNEGIKYFGFTIEPTIQANPRANKVMLKSPSFIFNSLAYIGINGFL